MSEHILKILLSELVTVRLLCQAKGCQGIVELPISKLKKRISCPLCRKEFDQDDGTAPLYDLADAFRLVGQVKDRVLVEFVVPEKTQPTT